LVFADKVVIFLFVAARVVLYNFVSMWQGEIQWEIAYKRARLKDRWLMDIAVPEEIRVSIAIRNRKWG
jgi:hypothetical protein